jgi:hypothetical protein
MKVKHDDETIFKKRRGRPPKHLKEIDVDIDEFHNDDHDESHHETTPKKRPVTDDYTSPYYKEQTNSTAKDKKQKHYVDTKQLEQLIAQYYRDNIIVDELAINLFNIAHRVAYMPNFLNYSWREEMIGDGLVKVFTALKNKKYNPKYGRAFAYFTQIVFHSFCNRIKKENKAHEVLKEYQEDEYNKLMFEYNLNQGEVKSTDADANED